MQLEEAAESLMLATNGFRRSLLKSINGIVVEVPFSEAWTLAEDDRVRWVEPALPQFNDLNDSNRVITEVDEVQDSPYGLDGEGVVVMVYDGGYAYSGHQDFGGRLTTRDDAGTSDHATHVAGTIGGDGAASAGQYTGMAPAVTIESYGFQQDGGLQEGFLYTDPGDLEADYSDAINNYGAVISNNSIGTNTAPNGFPCEWTGDYGVTSSLIDGVVRGDLGAPMRIVWANGNERQTDRCGNLYFTTAPPACAKNHITVGAMNSNDDTVTYFTSWGPSDDGRIKPDISAPGCQSDGDGGVTSTSSSGGYSTKCGTSMASPTACGIGALLIQDHRNQYPDAPEMANSTLKTLLAHTAFDAGNVGPDCQYGYGSIRSKAAIDHLRGGSFLETNIAQNESYNFLIVVPAGAERFQVTAAWDDVPAEPLVVPSLVNDIDVVVHGPDGTRYYPWSINPDDPSQPATQNAEDHINNIEQVTVANPAEGIWSVELVGTVVTTDTQLVSVAASPELIDCSSSGIVTLDRSVYPLEGQLAVRVVDCDLNTDDQLVEEYVIDVCSNLECETVQLIESGEATSEFVGLLLHSTTDAVGVLQVEDGGTISTTYSDASDIDGNPAQVTDDATVDGAVPAITGVEILTVEPRAATIEVYFDEPCQITVEYATTCGASGESKSVSAYESVHTVTLSGLEDDTDYFFTITGTDQAGNTVVDDNGGDCYTFMTTPVPDYFTEQFGSGVDLAGFSIRFSPNGSIDFYSACGETIGTLPVDPSGGAAVSLSDDDSQEIAPGQPVLLYGTPWDTFYVNSNGSLTFQSGDTSYGESLSSHFAAPRISALWDDLNPSVGGTVSWKDTGQSIVVTYENVPEYSTSNDNTFQIEFFDSGDLRLSWLNIDLADAVVGLSAGTGSDPDFLPTDLSGLTTGCGPQPPNATSLVFSTTPGTIVDILLEGTDDGLPDPPGALTYVIDSLPIQPLRHMVTGALLTSADLPYIMPPGIQPRFNYEPQSAWEGEDTFSWHVDDGGEAPDGGSSPQAYVDITVSTGPQAIHVFTMDTDPGWVGEGEWAWGQPLGDGGQYGNPDPTSGATGTNVVGYNLAGDYANSMPEYAVTTGAMNCSEMTGTELRFMRWLNVESPSYDHAYIQVSADDGATWTQVWENTSEVVDSAWTPMSYDISAVADGSDAVRIRWIMGTSDSSWQYSGWNLDDVELWGIVPGGPSPGDINGDGWVGVDDLLIVIANWGQCNPAECPADLNGDGWVGVDDLLIVIANWGPGRRSMSGSDEPAIALEPESNPTSDPKDEVEDDLYVNDDVLAPTWDDGLTQIDSGYLQTGNGVLELELGDTVPVDGHDVLSVGGTAVLGGGLSVRFGSEYEPRAGDRFGVVLASSIESEFDWYELPEVDEGLEIVLCYQPGVVFIEIRHRVHRPQHAQSRPQLAEADLDRNGVVNAVDLVLLMQAWGRGGFHDINGDGRFGPLDMLTVMDHIQGCSTADPMRK